MICEWEMLYYFNSKQVGSSGKGFDLCDSSMKSKFRIPLNANNYLELARPKYYLICVEEALDTCPRFTWQRWVHELALPWRGSSS
jgi:hypothetical protein